MTTSAAAAPHPPVAEKRPQSRTLFGQTLTDDYAWLRDRKDPSVIAYLEAENAYTDSMTRGSKPLQDTLYAEMLARIQQTDLTVPYRKGSYLYYQRTEEGRQYPVYCRRHDAPGAPEEVVLDLNRLSEGHPFMALGAYDVSPNERLLAYSTDSTGYRQYVLHVKDLSTGATLPVTAERVTSAAWDADSRVLFYTQEDPVSKRSYRLYQQDLGMPRPVLLDEERDARFDVEVALTRSGEWLTYTIASHTTSEVRVLRADQPFAQWTPVAPRVQDHEYYLDHSGDRFYIRANDTGRNFRLVTAPVDAPGPGQWRELIPARDSVMLTGVECFSDHLVLSEREHALPQLTVLDLKTGARRRVEFPEPAYTVGPAANEEFVTGEFRYAYQSFLTPPSVYDLDVHTFQSALRKRQQVLGGWDPARYAMERLWVTARDGARVPLTLVHRRDLPRDGRAPCLLYGYGSYGLPANVTFNSSRFSLLDRGAVFALAHVRGGGDLGKAWHDDGRMQHKLNTFTDFIDCGQYLVDRRICRRDGLVIQGGSAGGLLMGAVTNLRPDLFHAVLAQVPFVDVINTMLDPSLPLTVTEFEEWGDPSKPADFAYIRRYSPYDNLARGAYPAMLVKTSLNDSQVGFWEPTKYVARLRALRTDTNPLLLRCNMGAGHGGASGRYDALHDLAFDYAWILGEMGLADAKPAP